MSEVDAVGAFVVLRVAGESCGSPGSHPLLVRDLVIRASSPFSVVSVTISGPFKVVY